MSHDTDDGDLLLAEERVERRRGRHRALKALIVLVALVTVLVAGVATAGYLMSEKIGNQVTRIPQVFTSIPPSIRPAKPTTGTAAKSMNILLAGSDRRSTAPTTGKDATAKEWIPGLQRTDTIMVLHITGDRKAAYLISIPRDSWVDIPGHGMAKINAAFSWGGPSLFVETVEHVTGLRIDHLAIIDWDGFTSLTDALGGVTLHFDQPTVGAKGAQWTAGTHTLNGAQALDYVRERHALPNGDFGRMERQQNFLRALMKQTLSADTLTNPIKLTKVLDAASKNIAVDEQFTTSDMRSLALSLRNIRAGDVTFMTVPTAGVGMEGSQSVVHLDPTRDKALWQAVRTDDMARFLDEYGGSVLGSNVR